MGLSFRRSVKIAPGIKLNFSKSGVSTSIGGRGFTCNSRGRVTASIPGTGVRYTASTRSRATGKTRLPAGIVHRASPAVGKRAQANGDFLETLAGRMLKATQDYFFSWGICVSRDDFEDAAAMPEHAPIFEAVSTQMEATSTACRLLADIGSISLAEKEKAMRALYVVEAHLRVNAGPVSGLAPAILNLQQHISTIPVQRSRLKYAVMTGVVLIGALWWFPLLMVAAITASLGGMQWYSYSKARKLSDAALAAADAEIDHLALQEITSREHTVLE